jgi:chromosome segregation ATPase
MDPRIAQQSECVQNFAGYIANLGAATAQAQAALADLESRLSQVEDQPSLDELDGKVSDLDSAVDRLRSDMEDLDIPDGDDIETRLTALEDRDPAPIADEFLAQGREISELSNHVTNLQIQANASTQNIGELAISLDNLRQVIVNTHNAIDADIIKLQAAYEDLRSEQGRLALEIINVQRTQPIDTFALLAKLVDSSHRSADLLDALLQELRRHRP